MNTIVWIVFVAGLLYLTIVQALSNYEEGQKNTAPIAWCKDDVGFNDIAYSVKLMASPHRTSMVRRIVSQNYQLDRTEKDMFQGLDKFKKDPALYTTVLAALFITQNESVEHFKTGLTWWQKHQVDWKLFDDLVIKFT